MDQSHQSRLADGTPASSTQELPPAGSHRERFFDAWACFILGNRVAVVAVVALITLGFGYVTTQLPLLTTLRDFIPPESPGLVEWEEARSRFGGDEVTLIAVESDNHFSESGFVGHANGLC